MGALAGQFVLAADFGESQSDETTADISGFTNPTFQPGSPVCGTSFVANTYGKAEVTVTADVRHNGTNRVVYVGFVVRTGAVVGSGQTFLAADNERALKHGGESSADSRLESSFTYPISGLTPHATYNAVTEHRVTGDNADIYYRSISVKPLP